MPGYGAHVADEGAPDDERAAAADRREMLVVLAAALLSLPLVLPMFGHIVRCGFRVAGAVAAGHRGGRAVRDRLEFLYRRLEGA